MASMSTSSISFGLRRAARRGAETSPRPRDARARPNPATRRDARARDGAAATTARRTEGDAAGAGGARRRADARVTTIASSEVASQTRAKR
jgi:hypothetical protein